jgi:hypothetical protein
MERHISNAVIRESIRTTNTIGRDEKVNHLSLRTNNPMTVQEAKAQLEFKVTPYTIVNYSSRIIFVRSVYLIENKQKEYIIPPGESVEYEVDYEEEVRHLLRDKNEEVVKK